MTEQLNPLRILFSYHYFKEENIEHLVRGVLKSQTCDVFADSGAFSAFTLGVKITVQEYAEWLAKWGHLFTCAASLDVIGDAEKSFKQTEELRPLVSSNLEVLPVFHANDEGGFKWLQRYIDAGYTYIGISPGPIRRNRTFQALWLKKCFQMKPPNVRYHGFAVTGWSVMKAHHWYSVDSSTWTKGFRFAELPLFDQRNATWKIVNLRNAQSILANKQLLADYGLTPDDCRADRADRNKICVASILSWQAVEKFLTRWHSDGNESSFPSRIYLGTFASDVSNLVPAPQASNSDEDATHQ